MNLNQYQLGAQRTANPDLTDQARLIQCGLGLCGESGELADHLKKHLYHGHELDRAHMKKELGDILWYVATGAYAMGFSLEEIAAGNLLKLRKRYPKGFDEDRSRNRPGEDEP